MQRIGQPTEVSGLAAFLSMDHAAYITGQIVGVDGGFLRNGFY
jgi:Tropinone reductase 1